MLSTTGSAEFNRDELVPFRNWVLHSVKSQQGEPMFSRRSREFAQGVEIYHILSRVER